MAGFAGGETVKRPRVAIDVSAGLGQGAGIARYVRELVRALQSLDSPPELIPYAVGAERSAPDWLAGLPVHRVPLGTRPWRALSLISQLAGSNVSGWPPRCDLVHATDLVSPCARVPVVVTLHDLSFLKHPELHTRLNGANLRWIAPRVLRHAARVITDSEATARDAAELLRVPAERLRAVHPGCDLERFRPAREPGDDAVLERLGLRRPFVLFVGTREPRKNLVSLIEAFAVLAKQGAPHRLVLAGAPGWKNQAAERTLAESSIAARVDQPGRIAEADLPALYRGADVFVYPSLEEGFGLPPLEAMACGTPVVTSNVSSLPEVAGDAALTVAPRDIAALARAMLAATGNTEMRERLKREGPIRAARFSWANTARATAQVYDEALGVASAR